MSDFKANSATGSYSPSEPLSGSNPPEGAKPFCPYCSKPAKLVTGRAVYPHRRDLRKKQFWVCEPCDARCGCHGNTTKPLGRLANAELRRAKMRAHAAFDPIWKTGMKGRAAAYWWLASRLGLDVTKCHIGMFDVDTCNRVVEICRGS